MRRGDEFFHPDFRLVGDALGFGFRAFDDRSRFLIGLTPLRLVFGEQLLGLFLQPARLVELGLHALAARVERIGQDLRHADIDQDADENQEADGDPGFGLSEEVSERMSVS